MRTVIRCDAVPAHRRFRIAEHEHLKPDLAPDHAPEGLLIMIPGVSEIWSAYEHLPILPTGDQLREFTRQAERDPAATKQLVRVIDTLLMECVIYPRLIAGRPLEIPEGEYPIAELPWEEKEKLFSRLVDAAGLTEATEKVAPLRKAGTP